MHVGVCVRRLSLYFALCGRNLSVYTLLGKNSQNCKLEKARESETVILSFMDAREYRSDVCGIMSIKTKHVPEL
jgi:hypothetical protein